VPDPSTPARESRSPAAAAAESRQDGWQIDYTAYVPNAGGSLPVAADAAAVGCPRAADRRRLDFIMVGGENAVARAAKRISFARQGTVVDGCRALRLATHHYEVQPSTISRTRTPDRCSVSRDGSEPPAFGT